MSQKNKRFVACIASLLVAAAGLSAQQRSPVAPVAPTAPTAPVAPSRATKPANGSPEGKIFAFDLGVACGYGLDAGDFVAGRSFGIGFTVADNIAVGFSSTAASFTYSFFRASYYLTPAIGFNLYVGSDDNAASPAFGLGAAYTFLRNPSETGLATALKLRLEYLFDTSAGVDSGDIILAVGTSLGL